MIQRFATLSDAELVAEVQRLAAEERVRLIELLACVSEIERRKIHLDSSYPNLFEYCVGFLRWSENEAARRIWAARAANAFPDIYVYLRDGDLNLTAVARLWPHLTRENYAEVLRRAVGRRYRDIERLVVELAAQREAAAAAATTPPSPDPALELSFDTLPNASSLDETARAAPAVEGDTGGAPASEENVGGAKPSKPPFAPKPRDVVRLEAPGVVRFSFTADEALRRDLERAKALLSAGGRPPARLEELLAKVLDEFLKRRDPSRRRPAAERPRRERDRRAVPKWVKDEVWKRDEGRCAFVAEGSRRCAATDRLQFDHVKPWALGGRSDEPDNVRLLCRSHNLRVAEKTFGTRVTETKESRGATGA